jgi:hypothetical protein
MPPLRAASFGLLLVVVSASHLRTQAPTENVTALKTLSLAAWRAPDTAARSCGQSGHVRSGNCPLPATKFSATQVQHGVRLVMKLGNACQWHYRAKFRSSRDTLYVWMWPADYRQNAACPAIVWYEAWEAMAPYTSGSVRRATLYLRAPSQSGPPDVTVKIVPRSPKK